ncbi:MAG: hypothetical protein KAI57_02795 [Candidatus Pacebacteria bacterium]|nr:hypothetical protein [Candidatus Paceibacterota bacterium]
MKNWKTKIIKILLLAILLIFAVVILFFVYKYLKCLNPDFLENLFATSLALIAGIPIALWIDRHIKAGEENKKNLDDRKREMEILKLIREELNFSCSSIYLKKMKSNLLSVEVQSLKSDLWEALISSGEIKYIKLPELLNRISSAYYVLKMVKNIQEQAYTVSITSSVIITKSDGTKCKPETELLLDARRFDDLFESSVQEALKMIDERLSKLKTYEN